MNRISKFFIKGIRKINNTFKSWYYKNSFLDSVKKHGENIVVSGKVYVWNDKVTVGDCSHFYPYVFLWGNGPIKIGEHCEIGINTIIHSTQLVDIGNNVSIAANCYIIDSNHGCEKNLLINEQKTVVKGPIVIDDDVWIGAGAKILSGVHIGRGAVIGAQSVVNTDIPDYAIAVGIPAKVISYRR